jgi:site-specific DNA recombinase
MACGTYRSRAGCYSGRKLDTSRLEQRVVAGLKEALLNEDALQAFADEFRKCFVEQGRDRRKEELRLAKEAKGLQGKIERLVTAIADGTDTPAMRIQLIELEQRKAQADRAVAETTGSAQVVALLPNLPDAFRRKVENLEAAMAADGVVAQAAQAALREMIEEIVATPGDQRGAWTLEIRTRTDALLGLATGETPGDRWLLTMASPRGSIHYHPRPFIPTIYMIFLGKKCWSWTFDKQTSDGNA